MMVAVSGYKGKAIIKGSAMPRFGDWVYEEMVALFTDVESQEEQVECMCMFQIG